MKRSIALILSFCLLQISSMAQDSIYNADENFTLVFYNVENLFDFEDDPDTLDDEFTPGSEKEWTRKRYQKKLDDLSKVFGAINGNENPEIIGLCEVENSRVLKDLTSKSPLKKDDYGFVHYDSPDTRGIDVALLYRKNAFEPLSENVISIDFPFDTTTTRDVLYVKGKIEDEEIIHLFVNHWSSRREGQRETERKRIYAAVMVRKAIDSILNYEPEAKIVVMGDFNDEPTNTSIFNILNANNKRKNASNREFYNLMFDLHNQGNQGTYNYKGDWNMLDQIIVSRSLVDRNNGFSLDFESGKIFRESWILYEQVKVGDAVPNRTYGGNNYFGGFSDHLPVYVIMGRGR